MPNEVLIKTGTQLSFADHAGDFSPTAANDLEQGTPTNVQLALASVADAAARQSAKVDLGATRAAQFSVVAAIEFAATPTAGEVVELYWAASPDSTAANGNPGGASGSDAAYSGTAASTLAESVKQLQWVGNFVCTDDATTTIQIAHVGMFSPLERYGSLIVKNESGAAIHSDDVECHMVITLIILGLEISLEHGFRGWMMLVELLCETDRITGIMGPFKACLRLVGFHLQKPVLHWILMVILAVTWTLPMRIISTSRPICQYVYGSG